MLLSHLSSEEKLVMSPHNYVIQLKLQKDLNTLGTSFFFFFLPLLNSLEFKIKY